LRRQKFVDFAAIQVWLFLAAFGSTLLDQLGVEGHNQLDGSSFSTRYSSPADLRAKTTVRQLTL